MLHFHGVLELCLGLVVYTCTVAVIWLSSGIHVGLRYMYTVTVSGHKSDFIGHL